MGGGLPWELMQLELAMVLEMSSLGQPHAVGVGHGWGCLP